MSQTATWTPGPWQARQREPWQRDLEGEYEVGPKRGPVVAAVDPDGDCAESEGEANARLIAAAPELYAALCDAVAALELARTGAAPGMAEINAARTALAKAEGR